VAADAVARFGRHNDSWINGFSKEFAKELAALGWIGMTWPTEFGGGAARRSTGSSSARS
jgi:alkylation response protein AidB-like acyl-CoA dehydrogenase